MKITDKSSAPGSAVGTEGFMPPECRQSPPRFVLFASDLYSLAATYVKLRTGLLPSEPEALGQLEKNERDLLQQALNEKPEDRPKNILEWATRLKESLNSEPVRDAIPVDETSLPSLPVRRQSSAGFR